jgi:hypothetical protein
VFALICCFALANQGKTVLMMVCMTGVRQLRSEQERLACIKTLVARGAEPFKRVWNVSFIFKVTIQTMEKFLSLWRFDIWFILHLITQGFCFNALFYATMGGFAEIVEYFLTLPSFHITARVEMATTAREVKNTQDFLSRDWSSYDHWKEVIFFFGILLRLFLNT